MMELLCEESTRNLQSELVLDYIRTTAEIERQKPADDASELAQQHAAYYAGTIIARSCIEIDYGQQNQGYRGLLRAKKVLAEHIEGIHADSRNTMIDAALDVALSSFGLQTSENERMTQLARHNLRIRTAESLNDFLFRFSTDQDSEEIKETVGSITELTTLGILSRDPQILSMPALLHHDIGKVHDRNDNSNVDLTASWRPGDMVVQTRQIQAKAGCLKVRNHAITTPEEVPPEHREKLIERMVKARTYEKSGLLLISGCCDLDLRFGSKQLQTAELLVKEAFGRATPEEVQRLDATTERLKALLGTASRINSETIEMLIELQQRDRQVRATPTGLAGLLCNLDLGPKSSAIGFAQSGEIPVTSIDF